MRSSFFLVIGLVFCSISFSQDTSTIWQFLQGDTIFNILPRYGTKGVSSPLNTPGSRQASATWQDKDGSFWLFGGFYNQCPGITPCDTRFFNDLWKFNLSTKEWTWVSGDSIPNRQSIYGSKGLAANNNIPSGRHSCSFWTDKEGKFWLFGGLTFKNGSTHYLNDLWQYDSGTNMWKWVSGDSSFDSKGYFGSKGITGLNNIPRSRFSGSFWIDQEGYFWLFGGATMEGEVNDLWKYDVYKDRWVWMNGDSIFNQVAAYGTMEVQSASVQPGARSNSTSFTDGQGNLWLFGGYGNTIEHPSYPANTYMNRSKGYMNDLWKYNIKANQWTWIKGDSVVYPIAFYGQRGIPDITNRPGARSGAVAWTDSSGHFYLFGGLGKITVQSLGALNDLWRYDRKLNQWTWIKGDSAIGRTAVYQNINPLFIQPGAKTAASCWQQQNGDVLIYGGQVMILPSANMYSTDMWKISSTKLFPITNFDITARVVQRTIVVDWHTVEINTSKYIIERSADRSNFIILDSVNALTGASLHNYSYVDQTPLPDTNFYRLRIILNNGFFTYSKSVWAKIPAGNNIITYPNPTGGVLSFYPPINGPGNIIIFDALGRRLFMQQYNFTGAPVIINIKFFASGVYFLLINNSSSKYTARLLKL